MTPSITSKVTRGQVRQFCRMVVDVARSGASVALNEIAFSKGSLQQLLANGRVFGRKISEYIVEQSREYSTEYPRNHFENMMMRGFAWARYCAAKELLELLIPTLDPIEKQYVMEWGPAINEHWLSHSMYTELGGCPEGRMARLAAQGAEDQAKRKLTEGGVSEERQKLLDDLVSITHLPTLREYPPKEMYHVRNRARRDYEEGVAKRFSELAKTLGAPKGLQGFWEHISNAGKTIVEADEETRKLFEAKKVKEEPKTA